MTGHGRHSLIRSDTRAVLTGAAVLSATLLGATLLTGCAAGVGSGPDFSLPDMPKMPDMAAVASIAAPGEPDPQGSATELYTRIARGAVACWFAANGPLKTGYIYHAEADAPSRGGKAEITIHERDATQPNPRGPKAYHIAIEPKDEANAVIKPENLKMPEPMAVSMKADIDRWSRGEHGCKGATTAAGWAPEACGSGGGGEGCGKVWQEVCAKEEDGGQAQPRTGGDRQNPGDGRGQAVRFDRFTGQQP